MAEPVPKLVPFTQGHTEEDLRAMTEITAGDYRSAIRGARGKMRTLLRASNDNQTES